jgi:hypothetical protein
MMSSAPVAKARLAFQSVARNAARFTPTVGASQTQIRFHHPDPFNPKVTKGWKAAVKVRVCMQA